MATAFLRPTGSTVLSGSYTISPTSITQPWQAVSEEVADDDSRISTEDSCEIEFDIPFPQDVSPSYITKINVCCRGGGTWEVVDPTSETMYLSYLSCVDSSGNIIRVLEGDLADIIFGGDYPTLQMYTLPLSTETLANIQNLSSFSSFKLSLSFSGENNRPAYLTQLYLQVSYRAIGEGEDEANIIDTPLYIPVDTMMKEVSSITIPEGKVFRITKADTNEIIWRSLTTNTVVLEVSKIIDDTYAGETAYTDEQFILFDVYPESGGTVYVTYEGYTKTIVDDGTTEDPNAQQIFFGTFNGVSDPIVTPTHGTLTIDGDYKSFHIGTFQQDSKSLNSKLCMCVTAVKDFGKATSATLGSKQEILAATIPASAEYLYGNIIIPSSIKSIYLGGQKELVGVMFKNGITSIPSGAFEECSKLTTLRIPKSVESIDATAFTQCLELRYIYISEDNNNFSSENGILFNKDKTSLLMYPTVTGEYNVPNGITTIGNNAFEYTNIISVTIPSSITQIGNNAFNYCEILSKVTMLATTPPTLGTSVFTNVAASFSITVPAGCGETYKAAEGWNTYASNIVEAS